MRKEARRSRNWMPHTAITSWHIWRGTQRLTKACCRLKWRKAALCIWAQLGRGVSSFQHRGRLQMWGRLAGVPTSERYDEGMRRATLLWVLFPFVASACKCQMTVSVCNEVASTDIIFAGEVEAIEPSFLDSWNAGQRAALDLLNQESARAQTDRSPAAFAKLRDAYLKVFP